MQRQAENSVQPGRWSITAAVLVWTWLIGAGLLQTLQENREHAIELARAEARSTLCRALQLRRWVGSHGGVYVPVDDETEPRPGLSQALEREGRTPSGRLLTRIDPWDVLRQLGDADDASGLPRLRLTIWRPRSAEDTSEAWEIEALRAFEQGAPEAGEIVWLGGVPHLRVMHPLFVEPGCAADDGDRGYREGDLCGGISVAMSLQPYGLASAIRMRRHAVTYAGVWLLGLLGIAYGTRQIRTRSQERLQAEEEIRRLNVCLEERVRERTARWEAANKELEAFTYSVSHDLRAPLRAINGYARILAEGCGPRLDAEGLRILGVVRSEAERMGHLIDELLNFSRLGRGGLRPVPIDMTALVREVWAQCGPSFAHRQVDLELAPLPPAVADLSLLRQVWTNLIDNALKFTRRRERARIEIGGWTREGENVYFVKDNGAGFDMNYADKLFRFFQRLHGLEEFEGNGVGLALVQRIIRLHSGRVWAESDVDRGAVFRFALPQAKEGGA